ncbi:c-type cytochrome [Halomonas rhizosphaerae]|uniref:Cytochrome c n=1 Tax=Halomonas rhizosphaerae TaxID=3043296 RepID=A0ABT6UZ33_9GAMM|nr:cytochrome c [Halomonas rhizosphaerae]MDI5891204.1 cytochrome c [Halomonas rhizosphaerae]MDI5922269.1 cytochrome c [Halomonas rhizosphaerae]
MPLPAPRRLLLLALCWLPAAALADGSLSAERQQELETLLYQDCGSCHGMTLRGGLGPALPESRMNAYSRDGLAALILNGVAGTAMPGWAGLLTEEEARWLADHLQNDNPLDE